MKIIGLTNANLRIVLKEILIFGAEAGKSETLNLVHQLMQSGIFEAHILGLEMVSKNKKLLTSMTREEILNLNYCMENWVATDTFSITILGKMWLKDVIKDEDILRLTTHSDFWQRRISLASTVALNTKTHGGFGDTKRTLMICETLTDDKNDMIVKALSWALRQLSNFDPVAVEDFLSIHHGKISARVVREVNTKLKTGRKNPLR